MCFAEAWLLEDGVGSYDFRASLLLLASPKLPTLPLIGNRTVHSTTKKKISTHFASEFRHSGCFPHTFCKNTSM